MFGSQYSCFESDHQICINIVGSYACECSPGFQHDSDNIKFCHGKEIALNRSCITNIILMTDINECDVFNGNCSKLCNNTDGSYYCDCEDGFVLDAHDNSTCHGMHIL